MTAIRRTALMVALTLIAFLGSAGSTAPAQASFDDTVSGGVTLATTIVAAPHFTGSVSCTATTGTMTATWTASTTPRVSGYTLKVYFSDGYTQTVELPRPPPAGPPRSTRTTSPPSRCSTGSRPAPTTAGSRTPHGRRCTDADRPGRGRRARGPLAGHRPADARRLGRRSGRRHRRGAPPGRAPRARPDRHRRLDDAHAGPLALPPAPRSRLPGPLPARRGRPLGSPPGRGRRGRGARPASPSRSTPGSSSASCAAGPRGWLRRTDTLAYIREVDDLHDLDIDADLDERLQEIYANTLPEPG